MQSLRHISIKFAPNTRFRFLLQNCYLEVKGPHSNDDHYDDGGDDDDDDDDDDDEDEDDEDDIWLALVELMLGDIALVATLPLITLRRDDDDDDHDYGQKSTAIDHTPL